MIEFLRPILNRIRSFFRRIFNYSGHSNTERENIRQSTSDQDKNENGSQDMNKIYEAIGGRKLKEALKLINKARKHDIINAKNELEQTLLHFIIAKACEWDRYCGEVNNIIKSFIKKRS